MTRLSLVYLALTFPTVLLVSTGCSGNQTPQRAASPSENDQTSQEARKREEERLKREAALQRSKNATSKCWETYRSILANHRSTGFDKYEGLDLKLAEMDTVFVDDELRKHIRWHIDWIKDIRRYDGSPLDVAGTLLDRGMGALGDGNKVKAKVADLKKRCQDVRASLSEKYDVAFEQLTSYGSLPVLQFPVRN